MKKIIIIVSLILFALSVNAQKNPFHNFFGPIDNSVYTTEDSTLIKLTNVETGSFWLIRPKVELSAIQIPLKKDPQVGFINGAGIGLSYAGFKEQNGEPYQFISADLVLLLGADLQEASPLEISLAASATLWEQLSIGIGYNFKENYAFILTGITYSFN